MLTCGLFLSLKFITTMHKDKDVYYVYVHKDPPTQITKYIGIGQLDRAWNVRKSHRKEAHVEWIHNLCNEGYTLSDIVEITHKQLSKQEALEIESSLIKEQKPEFNELNNPDHWSRGRSYDKSVAGFAKALHEMGYGYIRVAFLMGSDSHMLAKRMIKNG